MNSIQEQYKELYENFQSVVDHLRTVYEGDDPDNYLSQLESELQKSEKVLNSFNPEKMKCENEISYMEVTITGDYPNLEEWIEVMQISKFTKDPFGFHVQYVYRSIHGEAIQVVSDDMTPHIETDEEYAQRVASINMEGIEEESDE